jgi:hypothetical protein
VRAGPHRYSGVSVTAVHPGLMRTGSHLHAEFGGDKAKGFSWFSALAGTPLPAMDAEHAAARAATAVARRSPRLVLTPAARVAGPAHGVAPGPTTRLSTVVNRALPSTPESEASEGALTPGAAVRPTARPVARTLRRWGAPSMTGPPPATTNGGDRDAAPHTSAERTPRKW